MDHIMISTNLIIDFWKMVLFLIMFLVMLSIYCRLLYSKGNYSMARFIVVVINLFRLIMYGGLIYLTLFVDSNTQTIQYKLPESLSLTQSLVLTISLVEGLSALLRMISHPEPILDPDSMRRMIVEGQLVCSRNIIELRASINDLRKRLDKAQL